MQVSPFLGEKTKVILLIVFSHFCGLWKGFCAGDLPYYPGKGWPIKPVKLPNLQGVSKKLFDVWYNIEK